MQIQTLNVLEVHLGFGQLICDLFTFHCCCFIIKIGHFYCSICLKLTLQNCQINVGTVNLICRCLEKSGNPQMLPIFFSVFNRVQEGAHTIFLTRCLIQLVRLLNRHSVDLRSWVDYSGTFGAQLFIQQHTKGGRTGCLLFLLL